MWGHGCGVSLFPQFYDIIRIKYQKLPRPYVGSCEGKKKDQSLKEKCKVEFKKSVEFFVMVSVGNMLTVKYCQNLKKNDWLVQSKIYHTNSELKIHVLHH